MTEARSSAWREKCVYYHGRMDFLELPPVAGHKSLYMKMAAKEICQGRFVSLHNKQGHGQYTSEDRKFQPKPAMLLGNRYMFEKVIGMGQSSVLVKAKDEYLEKHVAVKVMNTDYCDLGRQEAEILRQLNRLDPLKASGTIHLLNSFQFHDHFCMVFDLLIPESLLSYKLHQLHSENPWTPLRRIAFHLLKPLGFMSQCGLIHADLKPENVLFEKADDCDTLRVVDFGNAIRCLYKDISLYYDNFEVQTLLYRAPEVLYGVQIGPEIDMWSYGCVLAEVYVGKPIFYGHSKREMIAQMVEVLGPLPTHPYCQGKYFPKYESYVRGNDQENATLRLIQYLGITQHHDFCDFLGKCFQYNPAKRLKVHEAALHPFLAQEFGLAFLLPSSTGGIPAYYSHALCVTADQKSPFIHPMRAPLPSLDLLRCGTGHSSEGHVTSVASAACADSSFKRSEQTRLSSNFFSPEVIYSNSVENLQKPSPSGSADLSLNTAFVNGEDTVFEMNTKTSEVRTTPRTVTSACETDTNFNHVLSTTPTVKADVKQTAAQTCAQTCAKQVKNQEEITCRRAGDSGAEDLMKICRKRSCSVLTDMEKSTSKWVCWSDNNNTQKLDVSTPARHSTLDTVLHSTLVSGRLADQPSIQRQDVQLSSSVHTRSDNKPLERQHSWVPTTSSPGLGAAIPNTWPLPQTDLISSPIKHTPQCATQHANLTSAAAVVDSINYYVPDSLSPSLVLNGHDYCAAEMSTVLYKSDTSTESTVSPNNLKLWRQVAIETKTTLNNGHLVVFPKVQATSQKYSHSFAKTITAQVKEEEVSDDDVIAVSDDVSDECAEVDLLK